MKLLFKIVSAFLLCGMGVVDGSHWATMYARKTHGTITIPLRGAIFIYRDVFHRATVHTQFAMCTFLCINNKFLVIHAISAKPRIYHTRFQPCTSPFHHVHHMTSLGYTLGNIFHSIDGFSFLLFFKFLAVNIKSREKNIIIRHLHRVGGTPLHLAKSLLPYLHRQPHIIATSCYHIDESIFGISVYLHSFDEIHHHRSRTPRISRKDETYHFALAKRISKFSRSQCIGNSNKSVVQ